MKKLVATSIVLFFIILKIQSQICFTPIWSGNGMDHMNFYITSATVNTLDMQAGDEIGIFDGNDCVGVGVLTGVITGTEYLSIVVSKDDPTTTSIKDGYTEGNTVSFRLCTNSGTVIVTDVVASITTGVGTFNVGGTTIADLTGTSDPPTAPTIGTINQPTCSVSTGSISLENLPAIGTWTVTRYPGAITSSGTGTTTLISGLVAGSYTFTVTDFLDATSISSAEAVLLTPTPPAAATSSTIHPTCAEPTGTIVITDPLGAYEYNIDGGPYQASVTFAGVAAGSHNILVRRSTDNTCISSPASVTVNAQPSPPVAATLSTTHPTCEEVTGTIEVTAPLGSYEYNIDGGTYQASVTFTGVAAGSHNILVRSLTDNTCISSPSSVTVNDQPAVPSAPVSGGDEFICAGDAIPSISASVGADEIIDWYDVSSLGTLLSPGTTSYTPIIAGTYYAEAKNTITGCVSISRTAISVTVNALPTISGTLDLCLGSTSQLSGSGTPAVSTPWISSSPGIATVDGTGLVTSVAPGTSDISYTDINGCSIIEAVTVNTLPTISGDLDLCFGSTSQLSGSGTPAVSTPWVSASPGIATVDGTGLVTSVAPGTSDISYTDINGCSIIATVTINALPVVDAGLDVSIANGTSTTLAATVTGTGPFTYSWDPASSLVDATIEDPTTVNLSTTTLFTLTVTETTTACFSSDVVTISITGSQLGSIPTATPGEVCAGDLVQLDAVASGGSGSYTYTWTSVPSGFSSSLSNPIVNPTVSTTYDVEVNDGFSTVNTQVEVTVNALPSPPTVTTQTPVNVCPSGTIDLTSLVSSSPPVGGFTRYKTTNDPLGTDITDPTAVVAGIYYIFYENQYGCFSSGTLVIATIINCPPDVTPTLTVTPNIMHGITDFNVVVQVTELNNVNTNGLITVNVPKDSRWIMPDGFDQGLTVLGATNLNNNVWTYSSDAINHIFTTNSVISAGDASVLGFRVTFDPGSTNGVYTITSQIVSGSGGEDHVSNNADSEKIDYFHQ